MNHIFFDLSMGKKPIGRIVIELFYKQVPKTCENFRCLATGEHVKNNKFGDKSKFLTYFKTFFHKIENYNYIEGGDIFNTNGKNGYSIYGEFFNDENFVHKHSEAGLLSMSNSGRNSNSSKFIITFKELPELNDKSVVFGKIIHGMDIINKISEIKNEDYDTYIQIINCGQLNDSRRFLYSDPFDKDGMNKIKKDNEGRVLNFYEKNKEIEDNNINNDILIEENSHNIINEDLYLDNNSKIDLISKKIDKKSLYNDKLLNIKLMLNEARVKNLEEVKKEHYKNTKSNKITKNIYNKKEEIKNKKDLNDEDFINLLQPVNKQKPYVSNKNTRFGWEMFDNEAYYNAYEKRCKNLVKYDKDLDELDNLSNFKQIEKRKELLAQEIDNQKKSKSNFSRIRDFNPQSKTNYFTSRNKLFYDKLKKSYGNYTKDIEINLERNHNLK